MEYFMGGEVLSMDTTHNGEDGPRLKLARADLISSLILIVLGILFFSDFLFSSKNFYFRDILNFHYPLRKVLIDAYSRGEWPLWNPFIYFGQPMLANPNYMAFYPTNLLHLLFSFNYAFKLHFILHPILGGLGMYFLQRRLRIDWRAALAGSIAYEFSGTVLSFLNLYNIVPAVALLPWIGWALVGALAGRWLRRSLIFGALLALQIIAFEPLIFQCAALFVLGLCAYCLIESKDRRGMLVSIGRVGLLGSAFALGLAAIQILPTLELFPRSARGSGMSLDVVGTWSMHPLDFLNTIVPNLFGKAYTLGYPFYWGGAFHHGREAYLVSFFLGGSVLLLAALSFLHPRRKLQLTALGLMLTAGILALGRFNPLYPWLFQHISFFRLGRYPSKYFLLATLAVCILASLGVEVALQAAKASVSVRRKIIFIGVCGILIAEVFLGVAAFYQQHQPSLQALIASAIMPDDMADKDFTVIVRQLIGAFVTAGVYLLISALLVLVSARWRNSSLLCALFGIVIGAELMPANLSLSPLISDADISFVPEIAEFARGITAMRPFRVVPPTTLGELPNLRLFSPNRSAAWATLFYRTSGQPMYGIENGLEYSAYRTVDHLNTQESDALYEGCMALNGDNKINLMKNLNSPLVLSLQTIEDSRLRPLRSFDTRSNAALNAYWLDGSLPRAFFASGVVKATSHKDALEKVLRPSVSLRSNVILENFSGSERAGQEGMDEVRITRHGSQSVVCEVEAKTSGYLVLLDSYYPGWQVWVDGKESEVLQADYAFRAVKILSGMHKVEFRYRAQVFYVGLGIACLTLMVGIVAAWLSGNKNGPPEGGPFFELGPEQD
jgi:hypothetical protein